MEDSGERDWIIPIFFGIISGVALLIWLNHGGFIPWFVATHFGIGMFSTIRLGLGPLKNWRKRKQKEEM